MMLIDSHCHLDFAVFDADRASVIQRAQAVGIEHIVVPGVSRLRWAGIAQLCRVQPMCLPAYGLHPYFLAQHHRSDITALADWLETHPAVAIGEAGLDFSIAVDRKVQHDYFCAQLALAQAYGLPIILHAHRALEQVIQTLRRYPDVRFVIHAFSGSQQQLDALLAMGGYVGVGGTLTYPRAQRLRRQIAMMDIERMLLETDAPDQPLNGRQGQRNEPRHIVDIAQTVAELRGLTLAAIARYTTDNARRFFQFSS